MGYLGSLGSFNLDSLSYNLFINCHLQSSTFKESKPNQNQNGYAATGSL